MIRLVAEVITKQQPDGTGSVTTNRWQYSNNEIGERGVFINTASVAAFEGQIGQVWVYHHDVVIESSRLRTVQAREL